MRPIEWLLGLGQQTDSYAVLLDQDGLAGAAWKIAKARCESAEVATSVPTKLEVRAAARQIAEQLGISEVPPSQTLRAMCEQQGLPVL